VIWLVKKRRDDRVAAFVDAHQAPPGYRDEEVNLLGVHGVGLNYYLAEQGYTKLRRRHAVSNCADLLLKQRS